MATPTNDTKRESTRKKPGKPTRTCVGCLEKAGADELVRVVLGPYHPDVTPVAIDLAGGEFGRGAHVHASPDCLMKAVKGGLSRSFKQKVSADFAELVSQIEEASDRRISGLLLGAMRARLLAIGADAAAEAQDRGAPLLVVASDAGSVIDKPAFKRAIGEGRAVAWKSKSAIGALLGRGEVAVLSVTHQSMAGEIKRARAMASAFVGSRSEACRSPEVR